MRLKAAPRLTCVPGATCRPRDNVRASLIPAAGDDRVTGALLVPTCLLHSTQRALLSEKRSGGKRRLQSEHRGHPMLGDFNKPRGRAPALLRTGSLIAFNLPQNRFKALLIEPVWLSTLVFPMLDGGTTDP